MLQCVNRRSLWKPDITTQQLLVANRVYVAITPGRMAQIRDLHSIGAIAPCCYPE